MVPVERIESNPQQPRMTFNQEALHELAASIREHGVLQPILVRPTGENRYQLVAGERRWRASSEAGPCDDPGAHRGPRRRHRLEIAIIENLQREDMSPLEEATMYDRMVRDHGYSIRKLADKLGKDKGYLENRLRLADAPEEIRELVSVRKDTLSHAYELLKVTEEKKRRRLADRVARGELTLVKLRERIEGRRPVSDPRTTRSAKESRSRPAPSIRSGATGSTTMRPRARAGVRDASADLRDDSLVHASHQLADALEDLVGVLRSPDVVQSISEIDRANLAKYLTITKLKIENAIALVRSGETD